MQPCRLTAATQLKAVLVAFNRTRFSPTLTRSPIRAKLRVSPSVEVFETAHAFAQQISYEL